MHTYAVFEYTSQAFHASLPGYLSDQIESIQKRALRIVYPEFSYREALVDANLMSLYERQEHLHVTLFNQIIESDASINWLDCCLHAMTHDIVKGIRECSLYLALRSKGFGIFL